MYTNNYNSNKEVISATRDIEINVLEFLITKGQQLGANPRRLKKQIFRWSPAAGAGPAHVEMVKITPANGTRTMSS